MMWTKALMALGTAQSAFARVSFDLIYALPGQSEAAWRAELAEALSFGTEPPLALPAHHRARHALRRDGRARASSLRPIPITPPTLYELTQDMTAAAGLPAYEISNHARPGEESRHNLTYWRYGAYAGIGPGAHGRRDGVATLRHRKPENWLAALARNGHGLAEETPIAPHDQGAEALLMGLRLREGVDLARIAALAGRDPVARAAVARLTRQGLLAQQDERLQRHARRHAPARRDPRRDRRLTYSKLRGAGEATVVPAAPTSRTSSARSAMPSRPQAERAIDAGKAGRLPSAHGPGSVGRPANSRRSAPPAAPHHSPGSPAGTDAAL